MPFDIARVRALRADLGMSQREFAQALGVPPVTVYRWENERVTPSAESLGRMVDLARERGAHVNFFPAKLLDEPRRPDAKQRRRRPKRWRGE
jgi:transcriptional regulator with XRE-family HTH domain